MISGGEFRLPFIMSLLGRPAGGDSHNIWIRFWGAGQAEVRRQAKTTTPPVAAFSFGGWGIMRLVIRCARRAENVHLRKVNAMTIDERVSKLEQTIAALQKDIAALQKEKEDGGELVLDRLVIRDNEGRERIVLGTTEVGAAYITHYDANEKLRISAGTYNEDTASIIHLDANEKLRIIAGTKKDGNATIRHYDANGKRRIFAGTSEDGDAGIMVNDANDKPVGTLP